MWHAPLFILITRTRKSSSLLMVKNCPTLVQRPPGGSGCAWHYQKCKWGRKCFMSFLQQQTAWGLRGSSCFQELKVCWGRVGAPRKEGRKKKERRKKQDSHQKQTTTISRKKKIKRVFQVPKCYSPQQTRPKLSSFLPSHSATIYFFLAKLEKKSPDFCIGL